MKAALCLCLIFALVGTVLRILIDSAGARAAAKAISALCGAMLLLALFGTARDGIGRLPQIDFADGRADFEAISAETLDRVCAEAEKLLAERLADGIAKTVGKTPVGCRVTIERADLRVLAVEVVFARGELYSSYEVKQYVRAQCGGDVSVEVVSA